MSGGYQQPAISVVVPVKNESALIAKCLEGILRQSREVSEIIVIDSGSTDGTQAIANSFAKVRVVEIPAKDFNHGDTRNLGVELASGEYVLFTVGDAWAADDRWIQNLTEGFTSEAVAAVCGSQVVPHLPTTNPVEWFRPQSEPWMRHVSFGDQRKFDHSTPEEQADACSWDDVTALYDRHALQIMPFRQVVYGEDVLWARDALRAGCTLVYQFAARVYHFHHQDYGALLRRTILASCLRYRWFGLAPSKFAVGSWVLRSAYRLMSERKLTMRQRVFWLHYNFLSALAIARGCRLCMKAISSGDRALDRLHQKYCGSPLLAPQGVEAA